MKKLLISCLCFSFCFVSKVEAMEFSGKSYIVMEASSKQVLEEKNEHHVQSVASISKMMTCILAIENVDLDKIVTVDNTIEKAWGSGIYIHIKDKISVRDLLYGLMLRSGNDAALMIAKTVAGSVEAFVEMMNKKANDLGLNHTTFSNPTGLDEEDNGNRSCVYDMASLMSYCHQNPIFNEIIATEEYKREDGNGTWHNKNKLLSQYEYCIGGKTGYTKQAKRTLVTIASKDQIDLIIVTFNCGNDFEFHKSKYEEYYQIYKESTILEKGIITYQGERFFIEEDLRLKKREEDSLDIKVKDNKVVVIVNDQPPISKKVKPFSFSTCFKWSFMEMFSG